MSYGAGSFLFGPFGVSGVPSSAPLAFGAAAVGDRRGSGDGSVDTASSYSSSSGDDTAELPLLEDSSVPSVEDTAIEHSDATTTGLGKDHGDDGDGGSTADSDIVVVDSSSSSSASHSDSSTPEADWFPPTPPPQPISAAAAARKKEARIFE